MRIFRFSNKLGAALGRIAWGRTNGMRRSERLSSRRPTAWLSILIVSAIACTTPSVSAQDAPDRTVLPLAEPSYPPITELDVRKATPPPRFEVKAPDQAPNV